MKIRLIVGIITGLLLLEGCSKPAKVIDENVGGAINSVIKPIGDGISYIHDSLLGKEEKKEVKQEKKNQIDRPRKPSRLMIMLDKVQLDESIRIHSSLSLGKALEKYGGKEGMSKHKKEVEIFMRQDCKIFALEKKKQFSHLDIYDYTLSNCNHLVTNDLSLF